MLLFAEANTPEFTSLLLAYGPPGTLAAIVGYFVLGYGPKLIEAHLSFTNLCRETHVQQQKYNESVSKSLETLTASSEAHRADCRRTQRMVAHLAEAGKAATDCAEVKMHLDMALAEITR